MNARRLTPILLILAVLSMAPLIPGGPVENRSFAHIPVPILVAFNAFITLVVLGSIPLAVLARRGSRRVLAWVIADGLGYVAIFALDLLHIFPVSPTPMSPALTGFELAGLAFGLAIIGSALRDLQRPQPAQTGSRRRLSTGARRLILGGALALAAIAIIAGTIGALH